MMRALKIIGCVLALAPLWPIMLVRAIAFSVCVLCDLTTLKIGGPWTRITEILDENLSK